MRYNIPPANHARVQGLEGPHVSRRRPKVVLNHPLPP